MEATELTVTFNAAEMFLFPPICSSIPVSEVYRQFLGLHGLVCAVTCTVSYVQSAEFTTGGLQIKLEKHQTDDRYRGNTIHLNLVLSIMAKAINTYVNLIFSFF